MAKVFMGLIFTSCRPLSRWSTRRERVLATDGSARTRPATRRSASRSRLPDRVWAVEGINGTDALAQRLLVDGEHVLDVGEAVGAGSAARHGHNARRRYDAHACVVRCAPRTCGCSPTTPTRGAADAGRRATNCPSRRSGGQRLHRLLSELVPGQSKKDITRCRPRRSWPRCEPRDSVGKTRKRLALEQLAEMVAIEKKMKASSKRAQDPGDRPRLAPDGPDRCRTRRRCTDPADVGDVARFTDRNRFASWTGTAPWTPPPASRSDTGSRAQGTARPTTSSTSPPSTRSASIPRAGPTTDASSPWARPAWKHCAASKGASPTPCTDNSEPTTRTTATIDANAGPGGHRGASHVSSAAGSHPHTDTSDQPLPGPAPTTLPRHTNTEDHDPQTSRTAS